MFRTSFFGRQASLHCFFNGGLSLLRSCSLSHGGSHSSFPKWSNACLQRLALTPFDYFNSPSIPCKRAVLRHPIISFTQFAPLFLPFLRRVANIPDGTFPLKARSPSESGKHQRVSFDSNPRNPQPFYDKVLTHAPNVLEGGKHSCCA